MRALLRNLSLLLVAAAIVAPTHLRGQQPNAAEAPEPLSDSQLHPLTAAVLERYLTTIEALVMEGEKAAERLRGFDRYTTCLRTEAIQIARYRELLEQRDALLKRSFTVVDEHEHQEIERERERIEAEASEVAQSTCGEDPSGGAGKYDFRRNVAEQAISRAHALGGLMPRQRWSVGREAAYHCSAIAARNMSREMPVHFTFTAEEEQVLDRYCERLLEAWHGLLETTMSRDDPLAAAPNAHGLESRCVARPC